MWALALLVRGQQHTLGDQVIALGPLDLDQSPLHRTRREVSLSKCLWTPVLMWALKQCCSFRRKNGKTAGPELRKDPKNTKSQEYLVANVLLFPYQA